MAQAECATAIAREIVGRSKQCFVQHTKDETSFRGCVQQFCGKQCGRGFGGCQDLCTQHANGLFTKFAAAAVPPPPTAPSQANLPHMSASQLRAQVKEASAVEAAAM